MAAERGNGLCRKKVECLFFFFPPFLLAFKKKNKGLQNCQSHGIRCTSGETAGSRNMAMAAAAAATVAVKHNQNKQQLVNQSLPV